MDLSIKKIIGCVMAIALVLGLSITPLAVQPAEAATNAHMKSAKVKWDLKNNKTVTCKEKIQYLGTKKVKVSVKKMKTTKLSDGNKKTTFTITWQRNKKDFRPTANQVNKLISPFAYGPTFAIVDYDTGKCLEGNTDIAIERGVTVQKVSDWNYSSYVKRYGTNGRWANLPMKMTVKLAITYPASYTGLCLGVWMNSDAVGNASNSYWSGTKTLKSTAYYKKAKSNMHWMRIK